MPLEAKRFCPKKNHRPFRGRRCPQCSEEYERERGGARERGYDREWEGFRSYFLKLNPICSIVGCWKQATDVHHKRSLRDGGEKLNPQNCQSLCHSHHSQITGKENVRSRKTKGV